MHKLKYVLLNILLTLGLILSASSLVFADCNTVNGTCAAGSTITISSDVTIQAVYTANPLVWNGTSYDFNYSANNQTQTLTAPTNGTGNTSYSKVNGDSALSVSSTGTVTIAGGTKTGKYWIQVKAYDNTSGVEAIRDFYFYIYPNLVTTNAEVSYGDTVVWIYMNGLNTGTTASSSSGTLAQMSDGTGFILSLNNKFTSNANITFNVPVGDKSRDYTVALSKKTVVLFVHSTEVIYNNAMHTPSFYVNQIENNNDYENQSDLFTWELSCPSGVTNCYISSNKQQAQNAAVNGLAVGKYNLKVTTKSTSDKPYVIYADGGNVNSKTITFTINPFMLRSADEVQQITKPDGSTENITLKANTTITYPNQTHGHVGLPVVKTTVNGTELTLVKDVDYTVKFKQNGEYTNTPDNIGNYTIVINGINNYTGELTKNFSVVAKNVNDGLTIDSIEDYKWTGSPITPGVNIKHGDYTLVQGVDYTLTYTNNVNIGTATITINGIGNYTGSKNITFNIIENAISYDVINGRFVYDGNASNGGARVVANDPSTATVTYYNEATGQWQSTVPTFTNVGTYTVKFRISANGYTDIQVDDRLTVTVVKVSNHLTLHSSTPKIDANITASGNIIYGTGITTIYYKSTYPGTVTAVTEPNGVASVNISGDKITITPLQVGDCNIKFTIAETDNTAAGIAEYYYVVKSGSVTSTTQNGEYKYDYQAHGASVTTNPSDSTIKYTWDGKADINSPSTNRMPQFTDVGTYTIAYEASKTNFSSTYGSVQLKITPRNISGFRASLSATQFDYKGVKIEPDVSVIDDRNDLSITGNYPLQKDKDYVVTYEDNLMPGTAKVKITGIGNFTGEINLTFTIKPVGMMVVTTDGVGDYTGYPQIGQDKEPRDVYKKANVAVTAASAYDLQYSTEAPVCPSNNSNCTIDERVYNSGYTMPKFRDVGVHTVWYRVKAQGCDTVTGTFTITIKRAVLKVPTLFGGELLYTGQSQEPVFMNYNSKFMKKSGKFSATAPGEYEITFSLTDTVNTVWEDGTTTPKTIRWAIQKVSIKDHETIVYDYINYGEEKQIMLENGKVSFERPGYNQIAWAAESTTQGVKACVDKNDGTGFYIRECNYDYTKLLDIGAPLDGTTIDSIMKHNSAIPTGDSKETCSDDQNKVWVNGYCFNLKQEDAYDLYAVWTNAAYRIKYDMCDDKGCGAIIGNPETQPTYDNEFTVEPPKRLGYDFIGWTITGMDNSPHTIGQDVITDTEFTTPEEWANEPITMKNLTTVEDTTVTLKANWRPIQYEVRFNGNKDNSAYVTDYGDRSNAYSYKDENGHLTTAVLSGNTASYLATYDLPFKLTRNGFTLTGYTFKGWNTRPDGNGPMSNPNTTATISNIALYNRGTFQMFADQLGSTNVVNSEIAQDVTNLANLELVDAHINKHQTGDMHVIDAMNDIIREGITLYAQWDPNKDTKFTITYWKQNMFEIDDNGNYNTSVNNHNAANYTRVGTETYTAVTDTNVNITPYNYDMTAQSSIANKYIAKVTVTDTNANKQVVATNSNSTYKANNQSNIKLSGVAVGTDDTFYGFTPEKTNNQSLLSPFQNVLSNVSRTNLLNTWKQKNLSDGSIPADQYTYTVLPDGSRSINIYYHRNIYKLYYEENGGTDSNIEVRLYQEATTFSNPNDGALKCGNNNGQPNGVVNCTRDSGTNSQNNNNTGRANFVSWYRTSDLAPANQVVGINGAATTNETIYAKWMQYRYTVSNTGWTTWGRSE